MAAITPALIKALLVGWRADFQAGMKTADHQWRKIATEVPSTTNSNTYGWLGKMPGMREWIGDRVVKDVASHGYSIVNKTWEDTVGIGRDDVEDDNVGVYRPIFQELGRSGELLPEVQLFSLLGAGFSTLCYDGQNFFDTDHPVYPNSDGTGVAASASNFAAGAEPAWYLLDTSRAIKPLIWQNRRALALKAMTSLDDESVFTSNEFRFGADCRGNAGFSLWQLAYASKQELNADNLWAAIQAMRAHAADGGQKLAVKPTTIVVPTSLEKVATRLLERELDSNSSNELKGRLELVVADYL
jgi:phage major head subunit gpT-like protein